MFSFVGFRERSHQAGLLRPLRPPGGGFDLLIFVGFVVFIRAFRLPGGDGVEFHLHGELEDKLGAGEEVDNPLGEIDVRAGVEVTVEGDGLDTDDVIVPDYGVFGWWVVEELGEDVVGDHEDGRVCLAVARAIAAS